MARALEFARGAPDEADSPFGFAQVVLNLPGSSSFDPTQPWVQKLTAQGVPSGDVVAFMDDGRPIGRDEAHAEQCTRRICSRLQFLGNQDAARKRRRVGQRCGAWAGTVVHTDKGLVRPFFSQERWDKLKSSLAWMRSALGTRADRKKFLSARGFMVYASMTYLFMRPFMKGIHMSAES